ncbi:MAG: type VI secretion system-associated FHA domain protein TagH [Candidatus Competibacteraceae bacterium]|jgi:type VI secretion system protein|nr:type VI secretion system-associated FHA domain protein TagH [Candidatus Competibacteraceae bacterium]
MSLTLTITSYQRLSPGQEVTKVLDRQAIDIGRGPDNDWLLPDPERVLSGKHCAIAYRDGKYYLTDTSTNGVFINQSEERLGKGNTVQLNDGDELILGDYEIQVNIIQDTADSAFETDSAVFEDDFDKTDAYAKPLPNHFGQQAPATDIPDANAPDLFSGLPAPEKAGAGKHLIPDDADLLGIETPKPPPWWQTTEADHVPVENEFFQPPEPVQITPVAENPAKPPKATEPSAPDTQNIIPSDWDASLDDPFAVDTPESPTPSLQPTTPLERMSKDPVADPLFPELDNKPSAADPLFPELGEEPSASPTVGGEPLIPEPHLPAAGGMEPPPPASRSESPLFNDSARVNPAETLPGEATEPLIGLQDIAPDLPRPEPTLRPRPAVSQLPKAGESELASPAAPSDNGRRLAMHAFLHGAGLPNVHIDDADVPKLMAEIGAIFRQTSQGLMEVLSTRTNIKSEFRLAQTMIKPVENNPLKFSPNVDDAMVCLLTKRGPAFLPAVRAVKEGFDDIKAHQIAVMAGVQAALIKLLRRFDPEALESRLGEGSMLDNIMPSKRKARYWELFMLLYREIAKEAEDDFQELFGREFAKAYEEQINKL